MFLPDVFDPQGMRITVRVEPAHARYVRAWQRWTVPPLLLAWSDRLRHRTQRGVGTALSGERWVVEVEADDGATVRLLRQTRPDAERLGREVSSKLAADGMAALDSFQ